MARGASSSTGWSWSCLIRRARPRKAWSASCGSMLPAASMTPAATPASSSQRATPSWEACSCVCGGAPVLCDKCPAVPSGVFSPRGCGGSRLCLGRVLRCGWCARWGGVGAGSWRVRALVCATGGTIQPTHCKPGTSQEQKTAVGACARRAVVGENDHSVVEYILTKVSIL